MAFSPPARHLLRAKDLADARYFEPLEVDDLARAAASRARISARVPANVRRVAPRIPADAPPRARGRAAAHHGPLGRGHLLFGRPPERRLVHDELQADVRRRARPPTGRSSRRPPTTRCPALRRARARRARNAARFEKTQSLPGVAWRSPAYRPTEEDTMIKLSTAQLWVHDQDEALAFYTREARHGGPRRRDARRRWATSAG